MKRVLLAIGVVVSMSLSLNAQSNELVTALLNPENQIGNVCSMDNDDNLVYADNSVSDSDQTKSKSTAKRKTKSTSTSKSTGTSNGKTNSTVSVNEDESSKYKNLTDLAVYECFGDKYKRVQGCMLQIIGDHYRVLKVTGNKEVVNRIRRLINEDKKKGKSINEIYSPEKDEILLEFPDCTIGFKDFFESCEIFISYSKNIPFSYKAYNF